MPLRSLQCVVISLVIIASLTSCSPKPDSSTPTVTELGLVGFEDLPLGSSTAHAIAHYESLGYENITPENDPERTLVFTGLYHNAPTVVAAAYAVTDSVVKTLAVAAPSDPPASFKLYQHLYDDTVSRYGEPSDSSWKFYDLTNAHIVNAFWEMPEGVYAIEVKKDHSVQIGTESARWEYEMALRTVEAILKEEGLTLEDVLKEDRR